jgi:hypothetical protein
MLCRGCDEGKILEGKHARVHFVYFGNILWWEGWDWLKGTIIVIY